MSSSPRVQTVRNAWINRVRDEALRMRRPEVSKAFHVGMVIATYADADGGNAYPSGATIAAIAGCSEETVTRCVKLLVAVGLLDRKRRPNKSAMYQLLIPLERPDWSAHLHLYSDTRQARRKKEIKAREMTERSAEQGDDASRNPSQNGFRNPFPVGGPETVPAGGSEESGTRSGTGSDTVPERFPEPVPAGGDQYPPTSGRDPHLDHDASGFPTQPDSRAGAREANDDPPGQHEQPAAPAAVTRCAGCGGPLIPDPRRPGRDRHTHCTTSTAQAAGGDAA